MKFLSVSANLASITFLPTDHAYLTLAFWFNLILITFELFARSIILLPYRSEVTTDRFESIILKEIIP